MSPIKIIIYSTSTGKEPYSEWEERLDKMTMAIVKNRLDRVRLGNFGDATLMKGGEGIWELRMDFGPGYRIYFGKSTTNVIVLLVGGNKKNQSRDIAKAKQYWADYKDSI
jgi:putative addiction module killer protein